MNRKGVTATMEKAGIYSNNAVWYVIYDKTGESIGTVEKVVSGPDAGKVYCYSLTVKHNRSYIQRVYNYYSAR